MATKHKIKFTPPVIEQPGPDPHRNGEKWDARTKERAAALLFVGNSLPAVARELDVPLSTLRGFRLGADPVATELRADQAKELIAQSWSVAYTMLNKIAEAPVRSAQEAAVSYGILVERSLMMEARQQATESNGKGTLVDWMRLVRLKQEETERQRVSALQRPELTATVISEK